MKEYERAIDDFRRAVDFDPANLEACTSLAWLYVTGPAKLRDPQAALPLAKRAVAAQPDNSIGQKTLGVVYYRLGDHARAVVALERSLREGTNDSAAANGFFLAMCYWRLGDRAEARNCYQRASTWLQEQREKASPVWRMWEDRLLAFQAEADQLMTKAK